MADFSAAAKEAFARVQDDVVVYHTLEFRHSTFKTPEMESAPLRVVRDYNSLKATLEADAPANPSSQVRFDPVGFDIRPPRRRPEENPSIDIQIDNILPYIGEYLDNAVATDEEVPVRYRMYSGTTADFPAAVPEYVVEMQLTTVVAEGRVLRATCQMADLVNRPFPNRFYTADTAPYLFNATASNSDE